MRWVGEKSSEPQLRLELLPRTPRLLPLKSCKMTLKLLLFKCVREAPTGHSMHMEAILFFKHVGPRDQTQAVSFDSEQAFTC